jgi:acyl-CoA synthetase (AMP-forming)/AMP-acid ligase II
MPSLRTLPEALRDAAAGGHGCLFIGGGSSGLHRDVYRSYADLHAAALGVSRSLRALGLRRGDVVALGIDDAESFLVTLYGASMAGLLPASLHPPGATRDLASYYELTARVLRSSGARVLVTGAGLVEGFEDVRAACPALAAVVSCGELTDRQGNPSDSSDEPALDDLAFVQFTSGATSEPKGVALTHRNVCENVNAINGPCGLATTDADSAVSWLPLHHDMGLVGMALGPLYASRPAVFLPTHAFVRRPAEWLRAISRAKLRLRSLRPPGQDVGSGRRGSVVLARRGLRRGTHPRAYARRVRRAIQIGGISRDELPARVRARRTRRGGDVCAARALDPH